MLSILNTEGQQGERVIHKGVAQVCKKQPSNMDNLKLSTPNIPDPKASN
jgi:hypothetical protein